MVTEKSASGSHCADKLQARKNKPQMTKSRDRKYGIGPGFKFADVLCGGGAGICASQEF